MRICIVQPNHDSVTETFLNAQAQRLPADVSVLCGLRPRHKGHRLSAVDRLSRTWIRARRFLQNKPSQWEITQLYRRAFGQLNPQAVLAQYGPTGVRVMDACRQARVPLLVHFHGWDANNYATVDKHRDDYRRLFQQAAGIVAVSRAMQQKLISLGAPLHKIRYIPCGASCSSFVGSDPSNTEPVFLTVGRMIECKGPHYALIAFSEVLKRFPAARLRMVGAGDLLGFCQQLAFQLGVSQAVTFLGSQSHDCVAREMRSARALVHHSVLASTGDCEGTPVTVMEACASGLPVIGSRAGGIPDVVLHEQTGLLVDQRDITDLAAQMTRLANDPALAARLGAAAGERAREHFSQEQGIQKLWDLIQSCASQPIEKTQRRTSAAA